MRSIRRLLLLLVLSGFALAPSVWAGGSASSGNSDTSRSALRPQTPVRLVQLDSRGRYPFGQNLGGYRYPFSYPYYRYGPRQYPFGNGPYGPYGSNYGGYTGNKYDPGVYGRPLPPAPPPPPDAALPPRPRQ